MRSLFLAATLAATFTAGLASAASIVTNGDFETSFATPGIRNGGQTFDDLNVSGPSWNIWTAIPGWTNTSGAGIEIQSDRTLRQIDAQSGSHYVELDSNNNSSMAQDIMLGTGLHQLSFYYSPRTANVLSNGISFGIDGVLASENVIGPNAEAGYAVGTWTQITRDFTVTTAGTYTLSFGALTRSDSIGGLLDTVSVTALTPPGGGTPVAPVPLPAGMVLMASGLAGLAGIRRFRKAS